MYITHLLRTATLRFLDYPDSLKYIEKTPGDGLTGKSDEDNFGFTYKELDELRQYKENKEPIKEIWIFII